MKYILYFMRNFFLSYIFLFVASFFLCGDMFGQSTQNTRFKTVVIDAGHGGKDPGAVGKIVKEKDIVLSIALKVGEYLSKEIPDLNVVYTRETDVFVALDERAEIANKAKADLFVSIHVDAIPNNPKVNGAGTFVLGLHRSQDNFEVAKRENSVIVLEEDYTTKYEGFDPNSTESYIIFELMQNIYLDQSIEAASIVQEQLTNRVGRYDRGVKQAGFLVLRKTAMPSVLIEVGFITNQEEEKYLAKEENQVYIASAIFRSIREYKERFEARNSIVKPEIKVIEPVISADVVEFRIQIASSKREIKNDTGIYKQFKDVWVFQENSQYKYTTGLANDYETISKQLQEIKKTVPDCFVVAFKNGQRVSISSVR